MTPHLVKGDTLAEYFRYQVDEALCHQRLRALDLTRYYLVRLLTERAKATPTRDRRSDEPLALWYARVLDGGGRQQRTALREFADYTLFVSGFFSDHLDRCPSGLSYYASFGRWAYHYLSAIPSDSLAPAYAELGERFLDFVDVLTEVSENGTTDNPHDLLKLYERWLVHASPRNTERLARRGITPTVAARSAGQRVQ